MNVRFEIGGNSQTVVWGLHRALWSERCVQAPLTQKGTAAMQIHAYPFHDSNRTQISKTEMPVLNRRGVKVGCASSALGARTLLNAAASMQKVNGAVVFAETGCSSTANWSR